MYDDLKHPDTGIRAPVLAPKQEGLKSIKGIQQKNPDLLLQTVARVLEQAGCSLRSHMQILREILRSRDVHLVCASFSGMADEGSIEVKLFSEKDLKIEKKSKPCNALRTFEQEHKDSLEEPLYQVLQNVFPGWETGSGFEGVLNWHLSPDSEWKWKPFDMEITGDDSHLWEDYDPEQPEFGYAPDDLHGPMEKRFRSRVPEISPKKPPSTPAKALQRFLRLPEWQAEGMQKVENLTETSAAAAALVLSFQQDWAEQLRCRHGWGLDSLTPVFQRIAVLPNPLLPLAVQRQDARLPKYVFNGLNDSQKTAIFGRAKSTGAPLENPTSLAYTLQILLRSLVPAPWPVLYAPFEMEIPGQLRGERIKKTLEWATDRIRQDAPVLRGKIQEMYNECCNL